MQGIAGKTLERRDRQASAAQDFSRQASGLRDWHAKISAGNDQGKLGADSEKPALIGPGQGRPACDQLSGGEA
jgi:hypothetical protein